MDSKNDSKKNADFFECKSCDFKCSRKSNFDKHLLTRKHFRHQNDSKKEQKNAEKKWQCECGKSYKFDSGYYRHKKVCKLIVQEEHKNNYNNGEIDYKEMFITMMKENNELRKQVTDLIPKVGNYNNSTINKNKFNVNIFLNEECKDALTMNEFIEKIRITLDNLEVTKEKGILEGVSNIFIENMNKLSIKERPMHCTDVNKEIVYIKSADSSKDGQGEWKIDNNKIELREALQKVSKVQQKNLDEWTKKNEGWEKNPKLQEEYMMLVKNCTDDLKDKKEEKVIKKLCSNINISEIIQK